MIALSKCTTWHSTCSCTYSYYIWKYISYFIMKPEKFLNHMVNAGVNNIIRIKLHQICSTFAITIDIMESIYHHDHIYSKFFMQIITKWLMSICSIHVEEHNDKSYPTIWTDCGEERQVFLMFIFKHQQHCSNFHFVLRHAHNKAYGCRKIPEMAHFLFVNGVYTKI